MPSVVERATGAAAGAAAADPAAAGTAAGPGGGARKRKAPAPAMSESGDRSENDDEADDPDESEPGEGDAAKQEKAAEKAVRAAEKAAEKKWRAADLTSDLSTYESVAHAALVKTSESWKAKSINLNIGAGAEKLLVDAIATPDAHVPMGRFMATLSLKRFRYGADHTRQPESARRLYRSDGARFNYVTSPEDLNVTSRDVAEDGVKQFLSLMTDKLEGIQNTLKGDEVEEEEALAAEEELLRSVLVPRLRFMLRKLQTASYVNAVQPFMRSVMFSDGFYRENGMVGTKEFCDALDTDQYLLGCTNGVFNLRGSGWEQGASFEFHGSGDNGARLVSMSTGYVFTGNADGTPKTPEQKAMVEKIRGTIFDKIFFAPEMNKAARLAIGACFFGNAIKKLLFLLGLPNGGKSLIIYMLRMAFGDYFGTISPKQLSESKSERDPDAPQPVWVECWKKRVIVANEGSKSRKLDREQVCEKTGGDAFTMRGLHGTPFEETLRAQMWWIANDAPKFDGDDGGMKVRVFAVSADAQFVDGLAVEDRASGRFKRENVEDFKALLNSSRDCVLMMLLGFAREFADGEKAPSGEYIRKPYTLPDEPASKAKEMVAEGGAVDSFKQFAQKNLKSTLKKVNGVETNNIDWGIWWPKAALTTDQIITVYNEQKGVTVAVSEVEKVLQGLGYVNKKRNSDRFDYKKKAWALRYEPVEDALEGDVDEDDGAGGGAA